MGDGVRLAVTTFTVLPLRPGRVDRSAARMAMLLAPAVGVALGALVGAVMYGVRMAIVWDAPPLPGALAVLALALATRGIHLDGLADTVDGLGMVGDRRTRLAAMHRPEVGAFAVAAVVLLVAVDIGALVVAVGQERGTAALVLAVVTGRLSVTWACRSGVPAARKHGMGAVVAGTVPRPAAVLLTSIVVVGAAAAGALDNDIGWRGALQAGGAVLVGLAAGELLLRRAVHRLGGVTGDVLGAIVEVVTTVTLVAVAMSVHPLLGLG